MFATLPSAVAYAKNGKLRALMVTGPRRSPSAPEIPAAAEAGMPGLLAMTWNGVLAPKGVPTPILDQLQRDITAVMNTPDMKDRMLLHAAEVTTSTREAFAKTIRDDLALWTKLIRAANLKAGA